MTIIAVANQKGGVGKTTTVIHPAHYFAKRRDKVLVLDLDTQGHITLSYDKQRSDTLRDIMLLCKSTYRRTTSIPFLQGAKT